MHPDTHAQIIDILDRVPDLSLATVRSDGYPQATVVGFVHDDLRLYFMTPPGSQKALNLSACDKVSGTVTPPYATWDAIEGLSFAGHATRVSDPDEAGRVGAMMIEKFPQIAGLDIADTPEPVLFRIDPIVVSLLDYAKGFGHCDLIEAQPRLA